MPTIGHFEVLSITRRKTDADVTLRPLPTADQQAAGISTWDPAVTSGGNGGELVLRKIDKALLANVEEGKVYPVSIGAEIV